MSPTAGGLGGTGRAAILAQGTRVPYHGTQGKFRTGVPTTITYQQKPQEQGSRTALMEWGLSSDMMQLVMTAFHSKLSKDVWTVPVVKEALDSLRDDDLLEWANSVVGSAGSSGAGAGAGAGVAPPVSQVEAFLKALSSNDKERWTCEDLSKELQTAILASFPAKASDDDSRGVFDSVWDVDSDPAQAEAMFGSNVTLTAVGNEETWAEQNVWDC